MTRLPLTILLVFTLSNVIHYDLYKRYRETDSTLSQMLYLPSGKYLKPVSFGYHTLLADFIYLWSIQYYGDPGFHPRMEYLKHTYDLITELDPNYIDVYQTGALFMMYEGRNPKAGLQLLDTGLERNPHEWILPTDAGFYCVMTLKNNNLAGEYFEKAALIPDAPSLVKRMLASIRFRSGDKRTAYLLWQEVYNTAEKPTIKQAAFQHMHDLKTLIDLEDLRVAISLYQKRFRRYPLNLNQLVSARIVGVIPEDPEGNPYEYDPSTGTVQYSKQLMVYKRYQ